MIKDRLLFILLSINLFFIPTIASSISNYPSFQYSFIDHKIMYEITIHLENCKLGIEKDCIEFEKFTSLLEASDHMKIMEDNESCVKYNSEFNEHPVWISGFDALHCIYPGENTVQIEKKKKNQVVTASITVFTKINQKNTSGLQNDLTTLVELTPLSGYKFNTDYPTRLKVVEKEDAIFSRNEFDRSTMIINEERILIKINYFTKSDNLIFHARVFYAVCNSQKCLQEEQLVEWSIHS